MRYLWERIYPNICSSLINKRKRNLSEKEPVPIWVNNWLIKRKILPNFRNSVQGATTLNKACGKPSVFSFILYNIFYAKCQVAFLILLHCCEYCSGTLWLIQGYSCYKSWRLFKTKMGVRVVLCQHFCWELAQFHYVWGSPQFSAFACLGYIDGAERFCRACKVEKPHDRNTITYSFIMTYICGRLKTDQIFLPFSAAVKLLWKTTFAP